MRLVRSIQRHWKRWAVGSVAAIVVLAVGVPYFYIHVIEGPAPAPFTLSSNGASTTVAGAASTSNGPVVVTGTWKVASGSQVGYRIKESLFGQANTAVGRTSAVTGTITISGTTVTAGTFTADLTKVTSDRSERDDQFQGRIMDTSQFPTSTFALTKPIELAALPANGVQITEAATGNLVLKGVSKPVTFQLHAVRSGTTIQVVGSIPIVFANWNISNPSGGPATTEDHGILEFSLKFSHA